MRSNKQTELLFYNISIDMFMLMFSSDIASSHIVLTYYKDFNFETKIKVTISFDSFAVSYSEHFFYCRIYMEKQGLRC